VGFVVGGIGVAGLGVGGILGIVTLLKNGSARGTTACTGPATLSNVNACNALRDSARSIQTGGIVSAVVGGVAVAAGITVVMTAPRQERRAASIAFVIDPAGASVAGRF
jgi:hypothetical protein